ncbi:MAG: hypothetical protein HGB12_15590, partial [Bacteroidetes bacterium]|nr:hypothetical protein [Bacteroidota bacterium]
MTFLKKVTEHICNKYSEDLANICIVLPNRRAGLYIKKYISQKMQKVIWAPSVFSVEDFACHITGIKVADPVNLIFDFYSIYKNKEGEKAQPFNEFINWASVLLNDYNDADLNLADTEGLFKYLNETKAMSLWNLEGEPLTDHEKFYLKFYNSLSNYYKDFVELLLKKNTAYPGLINKKAAGNIDEYANTTNYKCVIFAGFNALTASEEKIIKSLLKAGKAEIFWDAEKYYVDNEIQEAGLFIRKYRKEWDLKEFNWLEDNLGKGEKNITITGVPLKIGQTELAGQILSEIDEKIANSENTALVLADENLLIPMLYAIPENIKHINITMGYPLTNSSVYNLFTNLFLLHENSLKYSSNIVVKFYFKDIINLLNSSILRMFEINDKNRSCVFKLQEYIKKSNRIFLTYDEICLHLKDTPILPFFEPVENNSVALLNKFTTLTTIIKDTLILNKKEGLKYSEMDMEYLFNFAVIVAQTRNLLTTYNFVNDIKTLRKIIKSLVETS